jgi:two-component system NarL family response regulator
MPSHTAPAQPIKVLLVDDHFIVRMGLASSLNEESDLRVVGEASSVDEALAIVSATPPDVAVVDMRLPGAEGPEFVRRAAELHPGVRCLMLSVNVGENDIMQAYKAGCCGYLPKSVERAELIDAIRAIARGETYFPPQMRRILETGQARPDLSPREYEVLVLVVEGLLNKEIAERLGLAEITVKQHVSAILRKLGVQDRTQAAVAAVGRSLVRLRR